MKEKTTKVMTAYGSVKIDWNGAQSVRPSLRYPHLRELEVDSDCRRQGHGTRVVQEAMAYITGPVTTGVVATNEAALSMFRKMGFAPISLHADEVHGNVVIMLSKNL